MTLDEAIKHALAVARTEERKAKENRNHGGWAYDDEAAKCSACAADHRQLEKLLTELKERREKDVSDTTANKPIRIDGFTEKCPKCGEKVMYVVGTGTIFYGASESYEDWRVIKHDYCPRCGAKIEREGSDDE